MVYLTLEEKFIKKKQVDTDVFSLLWTSSSVPQYTLFFVLQFIVFVVKLYIPLYFITYKLSTLSYIIIKLY